MLVNDEDQKSGNELLPSTYSINELLNDVAKTSETQSTSAVCGKKEETEYGLRWILWYLQFTKLIMEIKLESSL